MAFNHNRKWNVGVAIVIILIAVIILIHVATNLYVYDPGVGVGEGTFPMVASALLLLSGIFVIVDELRLAHKEEPDVKEVLDKESAKYALSVIGLLVVCVIVLPFLGFWGSMSVFSYIHMTYISENKYGRGTVYRIICSILMPGAVYYLFKVLDIALPIPIWL